MARQKYEEKRTISIIGTLNKIEDGKYMVTVENGDGFKEYSLNDILDAMDECVISLTSDIY